MASPTFDDDLPDEAQPQRFATSKYTNADSNAEATAALRGYACSVCDTLALIVAGQLEDWLDTKKSVCKLYLQRDAEKCFKVVMPDGTVQMRRDYTCKECGVPVAFGLEQGDEEPAVFGFPPDGIKIAAAKK